MSDYSDSQNLRDAQGYSDALGGSRSRSLDQGLLSENDNDEVSSRVLVTSFPQIVQTDNTSDLGLNSERVEPVLNAGPSNEMVVRDTTLASQISREESRQLEGQTRFDYAGRVAP